MGSVVKRKPYYPVDELCDRWSLRQGDVAAYALEGELTLSLPVAAMLADVSDVDHDTEGRELLIPAGRRRVVGTIDLARVDAFRVLDRGQALVERFRSAGGEVLEPCHDDGARCAVAVQRESLVVRHAELERFAAVQGAASPVSTTGSRAMEEDRRGRGAPPRYDWEAFWCELLVLVNDEGVPATQAELVRRMQDWFATMVGPENLPCETSIKRRISRVWPRVKPMVGRPSALLPIHGPAPPAPGGKIPRR
jgi:hypothetical protein